MFSWLKQKINPTIAPAGAEPPHLPAVPEGVRLYAIGDIHGRRDLLDKLLALIEADLIGYAGDSRVIMLGDYIDRGPDSRGVIERLMQPLPGNQTPILLMGNHEEIFLRFFTDTGVGTGWLTYGGMNLLVSYGVPFKGGSLSSEKLTQLQSDLVARFPHNHRQFLAGMTTSYSEGDYYFVHAGVRPELPLDQQTDRDRLWIRSDFLDWKAPLEKVVVHGHTISDSVETCPHRIGIDTGAYASGHLTALVLEENQRRILQT